MASRIVENFHAEISPIIESRNCEQLTATLNKWKAVFVDNLKPKVGSFNHWDKDDATPKFSLDKGIGWSALMLERCRQGGSSYFIDTGEASLDFCLISMELNLTISSKTNTLATGKRGGVNLDGLGLRRDGSFCILENKGPKDGGNDPCEATHQALCGALAAFALRDWVVNTARRPNQRRPAIENAHLLPNERSVGLYILMAEKDSYGRPRILQHGDLEIEERNALILASCSFIREIVYFWVPKEFDATFTRLPGSEMHIL